MFDVNTSLAALATNARGVAAYNDLGSGTVYGSRACTETDEGTTVTLTLNAAALAALNASLGADVGLGGALATLTSSHQNSEFVFGGSGGTPPQISELILETQEAGPIPEPASLLLLGSGAAAVLARRRRKSA